MAKKKRLTGKGALREGPNIINLVARHAYKTNRCIAFRNRSKYTRKPKHRGQEPCPMPFVQPVLAKALVSAWQGRHKIG